MELIVDIQLASDRPVPEPEQFKTWVQATLAGACASPANAMELTIRIVDPAESAALNERYRGRSGATNVLSFPFELPPGVDADTLVAVPTLLGDLIVCAPVVNNEAIQQGKSFAAHWAHMIVHGTLHLLGHDHVEPAETARMETLERVILCGLGFPSPYEAA